MTSVRKRLETLERSQSVLGELLILNFNLHTEHHLFPGLPWFRLKQVRKLIKPVLTPGYNEVHGIGWNYEMRTGDLDHIVEMNYIPLADNKSQRTAGIRQEDRPTHYRAFCGSAGSLLEEVIAPVDEILKLILEQKCTREAILRLPAQPCALKAELQ